METSDPQDGQDERILILAPTGRDAALTARVLQEDGLRAEVCGDLGEVCREMSNGGAGIILLTGESVSTEALRCLIEELSHQPTWSDIPLVILTSGGGENPANAGALASLGEAGNVTLIERPVRVMTLLSTVRSALRARRRQYDVRAHLSEARRASSEREQLLANEQAARREAEESNRLKDEFLATVSHELRTPLTAVLGWANLLSTGRLDEAGRKHALETIERNARSQNQLIEDLLDVSRVITGKLRLDVRPIDPAAVVEAAVEAVLPAATAKEIRICKTLDAGAGSINGDPARLQQVVWNLLTNAIKFTPRGGHIEVTLERAQNHIEISVRDSGEGIKTDFLPFVFDRFRQADGTTTRQYGGLGLGLSIVRHLVELHGGTVSATSPGEGQGATFTVQLPLSAMQQDEAEVETTTPNSASDARLPIECPENLQDLIVLVVDDEVDTLNLIKLHLEQCGAEVSAATSAAEAFGLLEQITPDIIISDIGMPVEDGFEFMRKVRALPDARGSKIPALALTAYVRAEDRLRVLRAGYQMHVSKPVELAELAAIVANITGRVGK